MPAGLPGLPIWKSPLADTKSPNGDYSVAAQDDRLTDSPEFQHYEETSNLQLFFDLFFVANLTSFTNSHEINSNHRLASYVGFFSILWFTWAQVTLYDVRFATDSFFERVAHACHFGVMVGFAIIGPQFLLEHDGWGSLQQLSLMLMADRVVLACEYTSTLVFTWRHRSMRVPLIIVISSLVIAAAIYLGISFAYYRETTYEAYIAWYVVAVIEVGVNLAVAAWSEGMSFKKTQIVERMSCLTLIILGEGIIGLTRTIVKVENFDRNFTASDIGAIISAVLLLYFLYQLYFDGLRREHFGPIRQQVWSMLHFPFHVALALTMEGINQMILTPHLHRDFYKMLHQITAGRPDGEFTSPDVAKRLNETAHLVFERFPFTVEAYTEVTEDLVELSHATGDWAHNREAVDQAIRVFIKLMKTCAAGFGFEPPKEMEINNWHDVLEWSNSIDALGNLSFGYLCICAGLVCIFVAAFVLLSQKYGPGQSRLRYIPIVTNIHVGIGIALLSTMTLTGAALTMMQKAWSLPALMLVFHFLIWVQNLFRYLANKRSAPERKGAEAKC